MSFKSINESFDRKFSTLEESFNYDDTCVKRLEEALNEAEISDEDKHDSDLIRSMIGKMRNRANAKFSPEEIAIMDKYGIKRDNNTRTLEVDGRDLNRRVDDHNHTSWYKSGSYNNGNEKSINYADRARKLPKRKDTQIYTNQWTADNDEINAHGGGMTNSKSLQDAERYALEIPNRDKMSTMKNALRDRKYYQSKIDNADKEKAYRMDVAQKAYDKAVADADRHYKWDTEDASKSRDYHQKTIDRLLKKDKSIKEGILDTPWKDKAYSIMHDMSEEDAFKMLENFVDWLSENDVADFLHQKGYVEYED